MDDSNKTLSIEEIHKEIDLIQGCINRMANNSFMVKGWMITLVAVLIALLADKVSINIICFLSAVIIICFWYLDAFFLKTERLFRMKYEWVIKKRLRGNSAFLYDLNPYNSQMWLSLDSKKNNVVKIMFSKTLVPFYGLPLVVTLITILAVFLNNRI